MAKVNNAPAQAGATPEEIEAQRLALEKQANLDAEVEAQRLALEKQANLDAEVEAQRLALEQQNSVQAEVIPANIFVAQDGTEVEFAVQHFIHARKKYTVEEAVAQIPEALQELYERNSFIFKKI